MELEVLVGLSHPNICAYLGAIARFPPDKDMEVVCVRVERERERERARERERKRFSPQVCVGGGWEGILWGKRVGLELTVNSQQPTVNCQQSTVIINS